MGIYKRKILRNKERKHAFDQEKGMIQEKRKKRLFRPRKKERKYEFEQEKMKENTNSSKKKRKF